MDLRLFKKDDLFNATLTFFRDTMGLQLQTKSKMPIDLESQFETFGIKSKKVEEVWSHVDKTYYIGLLDDDNFKKEIAKQERSDLQEDLEDVEQSDEEYPGILIFAVDLNDGFNPTRSNLTEINRTLNRFSQRVPALVLARYGNKISLMLADRVAYKQEWRVGEKVRKVSLLRDIDLDKPHAGHLRILKDLVVPTSGTKKVESFDGLYKYWKEVLDTSELNKKFYQDLSNWYFWAIKHVRFPDEPTAEDAYEQDKELDDMLQEHRATNVIRLLTRLLFVWFIKEKGLIPEELFDLKTLQQDILKEITPYHETGMFKEANKESIYYKAILQNLFFATLNCPIEASSSDDRKRGFRSTTRGVHFGVTYLMRYEQYFKEKENFLNLVNSKVPFLNGGLFECLDERGAKEDKEDRVWVDGFSDNLPNEHKLIVPDFLFFGVEEEVDLSEDYGLKSKKYKEAAVRGLLNIFNSYKFTITENTPIEEDVALDPELLGKVFENLLASYNPETKTTARKQTGSFYTPREIVNYMVDESLIAYLKNAIEDWGVSEEELDEKLHQLTSYEETVPFEGNEKLHRNIITALSNCTILDPACGSGAFPMGILQKMVHILQKLDTDNEVWKEVQKEKASKEADRAISEIEDKEERGQRLQEINEAFDERMNAPDYARKLFLIENCIYGVDIQPVATQISKLRFFISLVVEQKVGDYKSDNFGVRPLPNLETKFVTANTLIDIKDNSNQTSLYETDKIKKLEAELKQVRSKLFSARTTDTKYKYRQIDERLRNEIAEELKQTGWPNDAADKLASWDPYDQNASSSFFNPEWMFDITDGFDVLIGNPPYVQIKDIPNSDKPYYKSHYKFATGRFNLFYFFIENSKKYTTRSGITSLIVPDRILLNTQTVEIRNWLIHVQSLLNITSFDDSVFDSAVVDSVILIYKNENNQESSTYGNPNVSVQNLNEVTPIQIPLDYFVKSPNKQFDLNYSPATYKIIKAIKEGSTKLGNISDTKDGIIQSKIPDKLFLKEKINSNCKPLLFGKNVNKYNLEYTNDWVHYDIQLMKKFESERDGGGLRMRVPEIFERNKILTRQTADTIIGTIDKQNYYYSNTLHGTAVTNADYQIEFVLSILNSSLMSYYYRATTAEAGKVFAQIKIKLLRKLPIKYTNSQKSYVTLVNFLVYLNSKHDGLYVPVFYEILDSIVFDLYFEEHMMNRSIDVLKYVERDFQKFMQSKNFDDLDDKEKIKIIEQLHACWSDPENKVCKRINSFPEKSPDILKPILEG